MKRVLCLALCGIAAGTVARADSSSGATDDELRIRGIFDSALPGTERKNSLRLIVHPHFGDLSQRDYVRMPVGLRYGVNERLELTGETETFFAHGLGGAPAFSRFGLSALHFGTKYQLGTLPGTDWETAVGFDFTRPLGSPPRDVTDGLKHLSPYISFARRLTDAPNWRVFWSVGYDEVRTTAILPNLSKNQLGADAASLSGGFLYARGPMTYTFETAWSSSRVSRRFDHDVFTVRPGFVWMVPPRFTWGDHGRWLLGASLRLSEGPDGLDVGVSAKLRVNFNFRSLWRKSARNQP